MSKNMVIGIMGGMGSYATVYFFHRLIDSFPAEKEWDRPRIIIDNYCTMPSRVRAILYNEKYDELADDLANAIQNMIIGGANKIILACNTSHVFLPAIFERIPNSQHLFVNIIDECGKAMFKDGITEAGLIASEGTIQTGIYNEYFSKYNITLQSPNENQYNKMREFIESVKQNKITNEVLIEFMNYIASFDTKCVIIGCTEFPVLYDKALELGLKTTKKIFDPLQCTIDSLVKEYYEM